MMSSTCKDPSFCACSEVWLWCPECSCNRKLRHRFLCLLAVYAVDDQTESVAKINKRCCNSRSFFGCKYKTCRIFSVTHAKRLALDADRSVCDCRANFQHMSFQNAFFSRYKVVCVVFHEGSSLCIFLALCHDLHYTNHSCCLPVTFRTETISFFHQSLHCKSRKLLK